MRIVRQFFVVVVLTYTLAMSTHAGVISTPDDPPPPAPALAEGQMTTSDGGDMHTTDSAEATPGDAVAEAALGLVQVVLSLL